MTSLNRRAAVFALAGLPGVCFAVEAGARQPPATPAPSPPGAASPARPCEADPNFRKFDFWVGDWDVQRTGAPRAPVGASSRIERILDGCVIFENWEPGPGGAGKSFNIYNTATRKWEQYWVDATGRITHYFGEFRDDGHLYYEADQFGTTHKVRMTFFRQGPDEVRQLGHISRDGGKTWTVSFDLTYLRKK